jgi:hypothetical protein
MSTLLINSYWIDKAGKRYLLNKRYSKGWIYILTRCDTDEPTTKLEFTEDKWRELVRTGRLTCDGFIGGKQFKVNQVKFA